MYVQCVVKLIYMGNTKSYISWPTKIYSEHYQFENLAPYLEVPNGFATMNCCGLCRNSWNNKMP